MARIETEIGQILMVGISGSELSAVEKDAFERHRFGGFILFSHNCVRPAQIRSLCRSLWKVSKKLPPFIAIDQEGGRVHRLPEPLTHFPAAELLGRTGQPELAYRVGRATAAELALLGVNLDFAPVLDVNSNPKNPLIGNRSFGSQPQHVTPMALACARGLRDGGIIPCGKHFPGHGDTEKDSHLDIPIVDRPLDQLRTTELPPFLHACQNHIEALMTAHVVFNCLDAAVPATLSPRIITDLLRKEMAYEGVVFSDDMEMKSISDHYSEEEGALRCVRAGVDVLIYCHDMAKAIRIFDLFCREAKLDKALAARIAESYRRIIRLKKLYLGKCKDITEAKLLNELSRLNHSTLVDEIHGSL
ncbi:MAG: beta-N-acetylhexosaminidase [Pyrinomonadaceae bacterium]